ncbi:uncharacterized protein LOC111099084 [Crassostrea virginica]
MIENISRVRSSQIVVQRTFEQKLILNSVWCQAGYRVLSDAYSCSDPCEFPDYGARCSGRCGCSKEDCHHVHGCPVTSTVVTTQRTTSSRRATISNFSQQNTTIEAHRPLEDDQQRLCFRCVVVGVGIVLIVIMMIINVVNVKALRRRTRKTNKNTQPVV